MFWENYFGWEQANLPNIFPDDIIFKIGKKAKQNKTKQKKNLKKVINTLPKRGDKPEKFKNSFQFEDDLRKEDLTV